ncbi:alpha-1,2-mannosidase [Streptomyces carminius]|uniref:Alpha-1,2-mannosidase n=1 Tax=Streptomyces carminius TaxID=2665496 RepID=A0A2M8LRF2_9ACTN|nr:alpha-1,2-mannosidase [Streptomyces carminius]PJE94525.1 alpha-1,2-mannosidase [Streptomyces carminius]
MEPVLADFSTAPAGLSNAVVRHHRCAIAPTHVAVGAGGHLKIDFTVGEDESPAEAVVGVTVLGPAVPVEIDLNGETVAEEFVPVPDGTPAEPREHLLTLPGTSLTPGPNTLGIRCPEKTEGLLRLRAVTVDLAGDHRARRTLTARTDPRALLVFHTERRAAGAAVWQPAARLLLHLDHGDRSAPAQLSWRTTDGAESAVALRTDMSGFHGHYRAADGTTGELRGTLADRGSLPDGDEGDQARHFTTEEEHNGAWHAAGELRLLLDDGSAPVERLTWTDWHGGTASLTLRTAPAPAALRDVTGEVTGVEASDEFDAAGEVADNLLRKGYGKWLAHEGDPELEFTLRTPVAVAAYALTTANDAPDRDPSAWVLEGSSDGHTWTVLDSRRGERFTGRFETRTFPVAGAAPYRRYRLRVTENSGSYETQLSRVQFFDGGEAPAYAPDFIGYRRAAGAEPTGYRGTVVGTREEGAPEKLLAGDLRETARRLHDAVHLMERLGRYLD